MDDLESMIEQFFRRYDAWRADMGEEEALALERQADKIKLMLGWKFDDFTGLSRAARDVGRYLNGLELGRQLDQTPEFRDDQPQDMTNLDKIGRRLGLTSTTEEY